MSLDDPDANMPEEVMWQGRFITAKKKGRWEYVARSRGIRAAVILAVEDGHVLLVEQYLDFCRELADDVYIMDRGEVVHSGDGPSLDQPEVRAHLTV